MGKYEYKETGVEWLGKIPLHWDFDRVKDVSRLRDEKTTIQSEEQNYLELEDIDQGTGRIFGYRNTSEVASAVMKFKVGDVLFGKLRPYLEKYYYADIDGLCTGEILAIEPNRVYGKFLYYFVGSPNFIKQCNVLSYGTKMPRVNWNTQISTFNLPLPPLPEQKAIADYLDKACQRIDEIIEIKQKQLEKIEGYYNSRLHEAITKGLAGDIELIKSCITWQGLVPKHWKKEKLFRLSNKMGSGGTPKSSNQDYYDGDIPWIQSGDLNDGVVSETKKKINEKALSESSAKMFQKGTVLIAMYGATIGKLGIMDMDGATNQACCAIQISNKINSLFLFYALYDMRQYLISIGYGGGQQNISQEVIKQQYFYYPPKEEQLRIVEFIKELENKMNSLKQKVNTQITTLQSYRKSLIHECVTGKKQVWDGKIEK